MWNVPRSIAAALGFAISTSCAPRAERPIPVERAPEPRAQRSFDFDEVQRESIAQRPDLAAKVRASPYAYFRLLSEPFAERVCTEFTRDFLGMQTVNLHGDAHVEQYALTRDRFGLDDYDRGGRGPAVVDLVRFAASIHVACEVAAYDCNPDAAVVAFLDAYRVALREPDREPVAPSIVVRLRTAAPGDALEFLSWGERLMMPVTDADVDRRVRARWKELIGVLTTTGGARPARDFQMLRYGTIGIGIGSALETKFLFRVAGATDAPEDDLLLEWKSVPNRGASCVDRGPTGNMFLPLLPAARIGRARPEILAYVPASELSRSGLNWWVRSWELGYREIAVGDIQSQTELSELAADVGLQLGRGHCQDIADPLEAQFRHAHARSFDAFRARITLSARAAAADSIAAWKAWSERR
jgi:hypothetical protein